jgi:hypothetical protein
VVAGDVARPEVLFRRRADLSDPSGRVRKNAYQASRGLEPSQATVAIRAAERIAADRAVAALEQAVGDAAGEGADAGSCAVVVGTVRGEPNLESILASHALAHAAEGRLYQEALLRAAESLGLEAAAVPKRSIWEQGDAELGASRDWIDGLRRELGPPWAEDQKLAALAAWIVLAG